MSCAPEKHETKQTGFNRRPVYSDASTEVMRVGERPESQGFIYLQRGPGVGGNPAIIFPWDDPTGQWWPRHGPDTWGQKGVGVLRTDVKNYRSNIWTYFMWSDKIWNELVHLSYGRAQVAAPPPSLSETCGTQPAHRWEESGWTVSPPSRLPKNRTRHQWATDIEADYQQSVWIWDRWQSHHYLHGAPAWRSPVHGHALVYNVGHGSNSFCSR